MRVILLVLDGLGIGEMPDVAKDRPQDRGAHTLRSLTQNVSHLPLDTLLKLGLGKIAVEAGVGLPAPNAVASFGRSRLAHKGADSYLGHQEIMGTIAKPPSLTLMSQAADRLEGQLAAAGHAVTRPLGGKSLLLVDEAIVIGDNLEADAGLNINLTVPTDLIDFEEALNIGRIVRQGVTVSRVIVFGGPGISVDDIMRRVEERHNGQIGVNSPALGVYNERLRVQHMGFGVDTDRQAASLVSRQGIPIVLIGKMADLITCPGAMRDPVVPTAQVMEALLKSYRDLPEALIAVTVQETDLSAHQGDAHKLAGVLAAVDQGLNRLLSEITADDVLIICADHGNDLRVNPGRHTREETPLLIFQKGQAAHALGVRETLADIGATIAHLFQAPATQDGTAIEFRRRP